MVSITARMAATPLQHPCVLVFAGLDPSGGAGLVADAQAVVAQGAHALTVCTALTVQDNDRVFAVEPVAAELVLRQARALTAKITIGAVKIGIPGSAANALAIAEVIQELRATHAQLPVVLDPVLASGHGDVLTPGDAVAALAPLLPLVTVLTPNGPEAHRLTGVHDVAAQAAVLGGQGCRNVLVTGGHGAGPTLVNHCYGDVRHRWQWPRLPGQFHGSGCTLAAAIAGRLALGLPVLAALEQAQHYCFTALRDAYAVAPGQRMPLR
ncbi:hydroxymethylpyrimidine/phosphomethylpyrimidine kinase [Duganella sp. Leaf126]|uniref:bifunctional hydroxymethylpyrimidine kinase/phosphomethylpyrimidine kinase n=1 Tax=Duganella sp. Leaf126 TaxID=1736266 RepID=UPI0007022F19|nr:hydroxymethylpyrimidine/phosphomethylpyrimidine kinase [Duganella sp. Leaf126]KQQ33746.1 hydroxymethylpyrimidine/phosphomethylpyrimidine kinase [Duganella sp. Leaf126]